MGFQQNIFEALMIMSLGALKPFCTSTIDPKNLLEFLESKIRYSLLFISTTNFGDLFKSHDFVEFHTLFVNILHGNWSIINFSLIKQLFSSDQ